MCSSLYQFRNFTSTSLNLLDHLSVNLLPLQDVELLLEDCVGLEAVENDHLDQLTVDHLLLYDDELILSD